MRRALFSIALLLAAIGARAQDPLAVLRSPEASGADFGRAIAVEGDVAAVGAPQAQASGAVTLYGRAQDGRWVSRQRLAPGTSEGAFGSAVALAADRLVVGAPGAEAAYVFEQSAGGEWTRAATLSPPASEAGAGFGAAVALSGSTVAVAAPGARPGASYRGGTVYVFAREASGAWALSATLRRPVGEGEAGFGRALSLDGARLLIGAEPASTSEDGRAYVYEKVGAGWTAVATLQSPDPRASGAPTRFGTAVALDGDRALIGAWGQGVTVPGQGVVASGAAYAFERSAAGAWTLRQRLTPALTAGASVGFAVALEADRAVVAAPGESVGGQGGEVHVFARLGSEWEPRVTLQGSGTAGAQFGMSTALSDRTVVTSEKAVAYVHTTERTAPPPPPGPPPSRPVALVVREAVTVGDAPGARLAAQLFLREDVRTRDSPAPRLAAQLYLREDVRTRDSPEARLPLQLSLREAIGVRDQPRFSTALQLLVREAVTLTDAPEFARALALLVREGIGVVDGFGVARGDSSAASGAVRVDTERVAFVGPLGLDVTLRGLRETGSASAFFEEARPESPAGIPTGVEIAPYRWELRAEGGLEFDSARVALRLSALPRLTLADPSAFAVYARPLSGGPFRALATAVAGETIVAEGVLTASELALAGAGLAVGTPEAPPRAFGLSAPAPNPARGTTRVILALAEPGLAQVDVLDLRGRRVATLVQGYLPAGETVLDLRADRLSAGTYVIVLRAGDVLAVSRLTVVR
ncbi:hypothetical protein [Rubricoccus marinus]|uniref:Secretion system C-terminal sorting domain-containing protein n=1 Tax=Rubricoccus marinus TaxID=716817 RepID=A0A259TVK2_9BACT|nr:hypothetical protein [Rubricoccus marinus]OZC01795.1 hypothetical protein BSZ36_01605 [Rubricoccus marinus]